MDGTTRLNRAAGTRGEASDGGLAEACKPMVAMQNAIDRHWTAHPAADGTAEPLEGFYALRDRLLAARAAGQVVP